MGLDVDGKMLDIWIVRVNIVFCKSLMDLAESKNSDIVFCESGKVRMNNSFFQFPTGKLYLKKHLRIFSKFQITHIIRVRGKDARQHIILLCTC